MEEFRIAEANGQEEIFIIDLLNHHHFRDGILLASPTVYHEIRKLENGELNAKKKEKLLKTLYKYFVRCCIRPLPFGLFAGYAAGTITAGAASLAIDQEQNLRQLRLAGKPVKILIKLVADFLLRNGYEQTSEAEKPYRPLIFNYYQLQGFEEDVKDEYTLGHLQKQLFAVFLKSEDPFIELIDLISRYPDNEKLAAFIKDIHHQLHLDKPLIRVHEHISTLFSAHDPEASSSEYLQADLFVQNAADLNIPDKVTTTLLTEIEELNALGPAYINDDLLHFITEFTHHYGDAQIPLLTALNQQSGIIYPSSNTESCTFNGHISPLSVQENTAGRTDVLKNLRLKKFAEAMINNQKEVEITADDINRFKSHQSAAVKNFYLQGNLVASSPDQLDQGSFHFFIKKQSAPSALALVSKSAYGLPGLRDQLSAFINQEDALNSDVILTEIVFIPGDAIDNSIYRPILRRFTIDVQSGALGQSEENIHLTDLLISVKNQEIILHSKKLNKRIIPILTCNHNFYKGPAVYRFLSELQYQNPKQVFAWYWGHLLSESFLPRITYKHLILSKAQWHITQQEVNSVTERLADPVKALKELHYRFKFPQLFTIANDDKEMLIDIRSQFSCTLFLEAVTENGITMMEYVGNPASTLFKNQGDSFHHEMIIPVLDKRNAPASTNDELTTQHSPEPDEHPVEQNEWIYYKIYGRPVVLQQALETIYQLLTLMIDEGIISQWFFIRYDDPYYHLRLRIKMASYAVAKYANVIAELKNALKSQIESRQIWTIEPDTYIPEIDRYGTATMEYGEQLFYHDSCAAMQLFKSGVTIPDNWLIGILNVETLMNDFDLDIAGKIELLYQMEIDFFNRAGGSKQLQVSFDTLYRAHKQGIETMINGENEAYGVFKEIFKTRTEQNKLTLSALQQTCKEYPHDYKTPSQIVNSVIHMALNRFFLTQQNRNELLIYGLLRRYYVSLICKIRYKTRQLTNHIEA
ncbi:thiopeptide-type bacteriocin biosynthesis domain-containing protein [Mucilaginibacter lappiensis]|uniref:Thiopeptide-type bacteriocin biosynthesis protein n=1 Tax=Mucilaginibacter lappiensis TaxID=354630 RepID=A0ABR6PPF7_9SPHI|nr:lantibiotic dehydratase [Mucilaginibacter lappiensis]MBB6111625.1 thiopeptide-type bacteriocin biosynthesis protein [Mucilaginibacter lappiensis]SIR84356.1 thiopeptide-type bacteriocin biosynthesis domain-containing protein [Mucilaginibacter lappiensis]